MKHPLCVCITAIQALSPKWVNLTDPGMQVLGLDNTTIHMQLQSQQLYCSLSRYNVDIKARPSCSVSALGFKGSLKVHYVRSRKWCCLSEGPVDLWCHSLLPTAGPNDGSKIIIIQHNRWAFGTFHCVLNMFTFPALLSLSDFFLAPLSVLIHMHDGKQHRCDA